MDTTHPSPLAPLRNAINALINVGRDLHARLTAAIAAKDTSYLPHRLRANPAAAEARVTAALDWIVALARTLAGDRFFLPPYRIPAYPRFPGRFPALTNALRAECGLPLNPPSTEAERAARRLRYMRGVFAKESVGVIAARIARRLGIAKTADAWPTELVAIAQTPGEWAKTHPDPPQPPAPAITPTPETAPFQPPAYHKRE